jgi:hypothetical protein
MKIERMPLTSSMHPTVKNSASFFPPVPEVLVLTCKQPTLAFCMTVTGILSKIFKHKIDVTD